MVAEDKAKELPQEQEKKPLFTQQKLCKDQGCSEAPSPERVDAPGAPQELPAFFSLAALAEVAAMENVHRYARGPRPGATPLCLVLRVALNSARFHFFFLLGMYTCA